MSIVMLERAAQELTPFLDELVFVGGATIALWITDPGAPEPRVTKDVDVVVEVTSRLSWYRFEERLRAHGLRHDSSSSVICRQRAGEPGDELLIDVMPGDAAILGFTNRWQRPALDHATTLLLPSGRRIRAVSPPYLIATKLEAWKGRGGGDHLRSHDLEDVIALVDGRAEIVNEVMDASSDLHSFISHEFATLLDQPRFLDSVEGSIVGLGRAVRHGSSRVDDVFLPRLRALAGQCVPVTLAWMLEAQINLNGADCDLLFTTPTGRMWRERKLYRDLWKPAQEASGLDIRPHECRTPT